MLLPLHFDSSAATTTSPSAAAVSPPLLPVAARRPPLLVPKGRGGILHAPPRATRGCAPSSGSGRRRGGGLQRPPWPSRRRGQGDYGLLQLWLSWCDLLCSARGFASSLLLVTRSSIVLQSLLEFKFCALTSEVLVCHATCLCSLTVALASCCISRLHASRVTDWCNLQLWVCSSAV
jgi:hypothetical protein